MFDSVCIAVAESIPKILNGKDPMSDIDLILEYYLHFSAKTQVPSRKNGQSLDAFFISSISNFRFILVRSRV